MPDNINVHAARRLLHRLAHVTKSTNVELVHPRHSNRVDRIFSPRYHVSYTKTTTKTTQATQSGAVAQTKKQTRSLQQNIVSPVVSLQRQEQLLDAARTVAKATKALRARKARKQKVAHPLNVRPSHNTRLDKLEVRVTKLEKERGILTADLKELTKKRVVPLEKLVVSIEKHVDEVNTLKDTVNKNFKKAEQIVLRDERMLKRLRTDVKTSLGPAVRATQKEIVAMKIRLERLEAMHKMFEKIGSYDTVRLKELGERIFLTKQAIKKMEHKE